MEKPRGILDAVVLYDTIVAGKRGVSTVNRLINILEDDLIEIRPQPWRLDLLDDPSASENVMQDITMAQLIIISTSGTVPLSLKFKDSLATALTEKKGQQVAVIALLPLDESSVQPASIDLHFIQQLTLEFGLDFFVPWFGKQSGDGIVRIAE